MAATRIAVLQTIWDCRWSRVGYRVAGAPGLKPEAAWVCIRTGDRRAVTEEECENCVHWQMAPTHTEH